MFLPSMLGWTVAEIGPVPFNCLSRLTAPGQRLLAQHDVPVKDAQWYRISLQARAEGLSGKTVTLALQDTKTWTSLLDYQSFTPVEE